MLKTAVLIGFAGIVSIAPAYAQSRVITEGERKVVSNSYGQQLKDPSSVQYRWGVIPPAENAKIGEIAYCFQANAKNSYGGYTGFRLIIGRVKRANGKIISFEYTAGLIDDLASVVATLCNQLGYAF